MCRFSAVVYIPCNYPCELNPSDEKTATLTSDRTAEDFQGIVQRYRIYLRYESVEIKAYLFKLICLLTGILSFIYCLLESGKRQPSKQLHL